MGKVGRMTEIDKNFIRRNAGKLSVEDIAKKLDKTVQGINKWITNNIHVGSNDTSQPYMDGDSVITPSNQSLCC